MENIGVLFGSSSPEHDVSIITAQLIIASLKKMGYKVTPIYLTKSRKWLIGDEFGELKFFTDEKHNFENHEKDHSYWLDLSATQGKMVFRKQGLLGKIIEIDIAFPAFHGAFGEDGTIQGLLEMLGVPYVGCGVATSAIAMNKILTKRLYEQAGIKTTKFLEFAKSAWESDKQNVLAKINNELKWPVFVKPVNLGSSIGIAKVSDKADNKLEQAMDVAFYYDDSVLVEEAVENLMDVTCCVIGNEEPTVSLLQESVFQSELFNFEEKYLKEGGTQLGKSESGVMIPARLDEKTTEELREQSKRIYKLFGCSGIARIDYLCDKKTGECFANEINTLPGTLYHHLWKASGLELEELIGKLIQYAKERQEAKNKLHYTFDSDILKGLKSAKLGGGKL